MRMDVRIANNKNKSSNPGFPKANANHVFNEPSLTSGFICSFCLLLKTARGEHSKTQDAGWEKKK